MSILKIIASPILPDSMAKKEAKKLLFCQVIIAIESASGKEVSRILDMPLEFSSLIIWLRENKQSLLNDQIPIDSLPSESIAETINRFYTKSDFKDANADSLDGLMYNYRISHGLRFALRGFNLPDIYMGLANNNYSISCCEENQTWSYKFDMQHFLDSSEQVYHEILKKYSQK